MDKTFENKTYQNFQKQIPTEIQNLFDLIRGFCLSLGKNVVEDIRMHRIVFCKSMTFRWFADALPQNDSIILKLQKGRKEPPKQLVIKTRQDFENIRQEIKKAYLAV